MNTTMACFLVSFASLWFLALILILWFSIHSYLFDRFGEEEDPSKEKKHMQKK
jgi:hypothetical protein